jgi:hypothetical protein
VKGFGKAVREKLTEAGCRFVRHGRGDMSRHMANKVLKDAGLPKAF